MPPETSLTPTSDKASITHHPLFERPAENAQSLVSKLHDTCQDAISAGVMTFEAADALLGSIQILIDLYGSKTRRAEPELLALYHPLETVWELLQRGIFDPVTLQVALLHDVIEDGSVPLDIAIRYGAVPDAAAHVTGCYKLWHAPQEVARAILAERGVTDEVFDLVWRLSSKRNHEKLDQTPAGEKKYYQGLMDDARLLVIKACDRLTSLRSFGRTTADPEERRRAPNKRRRTKEYLIPALQQMKQNMFLVGHVPYSIWLDQLELDLRLTCQQLDADLHHRERIAAALG